MEYRFFTGEDWQEQSLIWERARLHERILKETFAAELPNAETFRDRLIEHYEDEKSAYRQFLYSLGLILGKAHLLGIKFERGKRLHYDKSRRDLEVYEYGMKAQGRGMTLDKARRFAIRTKKHLKNVSTSSWHDAFKRGFELSHPGEEFGTKTSRRHRDIQIPDSIVCADCEKKDTPECRAANKLSYNSMMFAQPCPLIETQLTALTPSDREGHVDFSDVEPFLESEDLDPTE
jgi:hypothetical protein